MRRLLAFTLSLLLLSLSGCALLPQHDPLNINVVGIEPLPSQDMDGNPAPANLQYPFGVQRHADGDCRLSGKRWL
jgi:hypothetical protein